ncbi:hypothetical protein [Mesorhizobium sp.]|uniref:hypothetical protein n=1 Tax=Mesorhizobium sp. TaxID=1871066 RepID=UPI00258048AB|nr:hypothetical protein [Mesorhizobium sp.]
MTKVLPLPARQVEAICKGAAKAGFVAELKIGNILVRLMPENHGKLQVEVDGKGKGYL